MDITLLLLAWKFISVPVTSFNPCFNGYYTSTTTEKVGKGEFILVSILVLMDITLLLDASSSTT